MRAGRSLSWCAVSPSAPNKDMPAAPVLPAGRLVIALSASLALAYGLGHLNWYLDTPLGRVPVLDERENLDLAASIASHTLAAEPFYRAPGYALVLACLRWTVAPAGGLFAAALLLGVLLHATGAALAARIACRWFGTASGTAAGFLYALNPVLVHFATQALDNTLALALFMAGLDALAGASDEPGKARRWGLASAFWAAATLVRPNYLLVWVLLPPLAMRPGTRRPAVVAASLCGVLLFGAQSAWQWRVSGIPGFLPWQGSYNLWSANRPGANGLYYSQRISLPPALARQNPARAESVLLYAQESPGAPADIASMNAHWRGRFLEEATRHPLRWGALMARKGYALLNNWEQYNNKTYVFHKALSPWLRWNPLGFGLLLILGVAGAVRLGSERPAVAGDAAWVAAAAAASVILFFASARFRLPLAALLTVLAGGALGRPGFFVTTLGGRARAMLAAGMLAAALVAFSNAGSIQSRETFVQDHVLLARAAFTVGDDARALAEAREALRQQPWHPDAQAIAEAAAAELAKAPPHP